MSMAPAPISIRDVLAPMTSSKRNGDECCRSKWWTRKYAPAGPDCRHSPCPNTRWSIALARAPRGNGDRSLCATVAVVEQVSVRDLRNRTADVLRRVESGEHVQITVDRRPVAVLAPLPRRSAWVPGERAAAGLVQADPGLRTELDEALPDTVDEL